MFVAKSVVAATAAATAAAVAAAKHVCKRAVLPHGVEKGDKAGGAGSGKNAFQSVAAGSRGNKKKY